MSLDFGQLGMLRNCNKFIFILTDFVSVSLLNMSKTSFEFYKRLHIKFRKLKYVDT